MKQDTTGHKVLRDGKARGARPALADKRVKLVNRDLQVRKLTEILQLAINVISWPSNIFRHFELAT